MKNGGHPLEIWTASFVGGLRSLRREPLLAMRRLLLPVSYWRSREFAYVWRQLACPPGARVLDVGSPKLLAPLLARHCGYHVVATDIVPATVELGRRYAQAEGLNGGMVKSEVQDGRALTYPDTSFDAAYSVSVLEHIPERGDALAVRELLRVVRPGPAGAGRAPAPKRPR